MSKKEKWDSEVATYLASLAATDKTVQEGMYSALKSRLGIQMQEMHGGTMNGQGVRIFYSKRQEIMEGLRKMQLFSIQGEPRPLFGAEDKTWLDNISKLLDKVAEISGLASAYRPLCKHEVLTLRKRCYDYGDFFPVAFGKTVTNKGHGVCHHLWRYNEIWAPRGQSSGLHVEQFAEAVHQMVKRIKKNFMNQPRKERTEAIFRELQVHTRVQRGRKEFASKEKENE